MADFTAKDVQALRQATGAGMMDAKKALTETDGDMDAARKLLREKGLAKADDRAGRENAQGAIAIATNVGTVGLVELKCETDFVAKSDNFIRLTQELADSVAAQGESGVAAHQHAIDDLKVTLKENIEVGGVVQIKLCRGRDRRHLPAPPGRPGRQRRGRRAAGRHARAGARHRACTSRSPSRSTSPATRCPRTWSPRSARRCSSITKAEGKPEAAWPKIVEGRLTGWYKERVLLDQPFVRDDKLTVAQLAEGGEATIVRFAQLFIGG